jgi:hypothetical protein
MKRPNDLKTDGRELWDQLTDDYDICGLEHLVAELCRLADRLAEIRHRMDGAKTSSEYAQLCGSEAKCMGSYARLVRLLGIPNAPAPNRRPTCR